MAFCGHLNSSGELVLRKEIYMGETRIRRSSWSNDSPIRSPSSPVSLPQYTSRTYAVKNDANAGDVFKGQPQGSSPDGWSLMYGGLKQSHCVPSLLLGSQPSSVNYLRNIDDMKDYRESDGAFENWYSAKRRQRMEKHKMLKRERDSEEERAKERKQLAEMCYDQWLKSKARQAAAQRVETHIQTAALKASQSLTKTTIPSPSSSYGSATLAGSASSTSMANRTLRNISQDKIRQVVEDWWLKKQQQHQAQRKEKRRALVSKELEQERRKQLSQMAWKRWMSNVDEKPKPVPLNQGMDTLRGTISPLYTNPRPWVGSVSKPSKM